MGKGNIGVKKEVTTHGLYSLMFGCLLHHIDPS